MIDPDPHRGTGRSYRTLEIVAKAAREGKNCVHVVPNQSFIAVCVGMLRKIVGDENVEWYPSLNRAKIGTGVVTFMVPASNPDVMRGRSISGFHFDHAVYDHADDDEKRAQLRAWIDAHTRWEN